VIAALVVGVVTAMLLAFYPVLVGPTVFDRMVGVGMIGTTTVIVLCLVGYGFGRLDMFVDIAIAYALLNFVGAIAVAKYLDTSGGTPT